MSDSLPADTVDQLVPILAGLARTLARGVDVSDEDVRTLLDVSGVEGTEVATGELMRWVRLLRTTRDSPSESKRAIAIEGLCLRGVPEGPATLAVAAVADAPAPAAVPATGGQRLGVSVSSLDLGILAPGATARASFEVRGGPGRVESESDVLIVRPSEFGADPTTIEVRVSSRDVGMFWSTIRLIAAAETLEIPVSALWEQLEAHHPYDAPVVPPVQVMHRASPPPAPALHRPTFGGAPHLDLEDMLRRARPGDVISLPAGTFELRQGFVLTIPITLTGAGNQHTNIVSAGGKFVLCYRGNGRLVLGDLALAWAGSTIADVVVIRGGDVVIERCSFSDAPVIGDLCGSGLLIEQAGNVSVQGCRFDSNGYGIYAEGIAHGQFHDNTCADNAETGILVGGSGGHALQRNTCRRNGSGIVISGTAGPTLSNNTCVSNQEDGIAYTERSRGFCIGNTCRANGESGIGVYDRAEPLLRENTVEENRGTGLFIAESAAPRLRGNITHANHDGDVDDRRASAIGTGRGQR